MKNKQSMNKLLLASTSTLFGQDYLSYLLPELKTFFQGVDCITFIPFARPGGCSENEYTRKVRKTFEALDIAVIGLDEVIDPIDALNQAKGIFTGGGNTFLLVKRLYDLKLIEPLNEALQRGVPYLGTSAGSNICGLGMHTTNDMPIVHPPSLKTLGRVPFNINAHYIEQQKVPVVGLPEGTWLSVQDQEIIIKGNFAAVVFPPEQPRYTVRPNEELVF
jgi:dipeptidase E